MQVPLSASAPIVLKLERAPKIRGQVLEANGSPVANASVTVRCGGELSGPTAETRHDARFEPVAARTGTCELQAHHGSAKSTES